MKKLLSLLLVITIVLSLSACGGGKVTSNIGKDSDESTIKYTGKKIDGEIMAASVYSEGLAFVPRIDVSDV